MSSTTDAIINSVILGPVVKGFARHPLTVGGTPRDVTFDAAGTTAIITNQADFITVVH